MKTTKDLDLLRVLADFRLATAPLLAVRLGISEQMIRRRCRKLADHGLLKAIPRNPGQGRGRPEWIYSLTSEGIRPLITAKLLPADVPADQVTGESVARIAEHQMLLNRLALRTTAIAELGDHFAVRFISSTSPFHLSNARGTILRDKVEFPDGREVLFTPDAAFCITHRILNKSLLFFVEIDMGTEVIADPKHVSNADVRRKIIVYRIYLGRRGYKRYENLFNANLNGFRLLLVSATPQRRASLCRLVRSLRPSDFVWGTDYSTIQQVGLGQKIWSVGGCDDMKHSILTRCKTGTTPRELDARLQVSGSH